MITERHAGVTHQIKVHDLGRCGIGLRRVCYDQRLARGNDPFTGRSLLIERLVVDDPAVLNERGRDDLFLFVLRLKLADEDAIHAKNA